MWACLLRRGSYCRSSSCPLGRRSEPAFGFCERVDQAPPLSFVVGIMSPERRLFALRCAAWLSVLLTAYLSLVPKSIEMRTPAPPGVEHFVAYAGTAMLMVL